MDRKQRLRPYPGFVAGPARQGVEPPFGDHKVLRGASNATHRGLRNARFRRSAAPADDSGFFGLRSCAA